MAVLCIALGIATNVTAFSVVNAVFLRPFPYAEPERLMMVRSINPHREVEFGAISYLDYLDLRAQSRSFSQMAAYGVRNLAVASGGDEPEQVSGVAMSAGLFPMLGEKPALGRLIREDEDRPGAPPVVLLGHNLWMRRFGGDPGIVGRSVTIDSVGHTVVGVMAPRFAFPEEQEAWVALAPLAHPDLRSDRRYAVMARLAPGASGGQAAQEVEAIAGRLGSLHPATNAGWGGVLRTLRDEFAGPDMRLVVLIIQGAVIVILLIACANVANLFLARAISRQREMAVRLAFGAGRGRLVRQLLTESLLIAGLGGALGLLLGAFGIRWMAASIPTESSPPYWLRFEIDANVLLYTLAVTALTGLLFGLAPALQAARQDLNGTLKEGGRGSGGSVRRNRLRNSLVIAEIALALALLVVTALFLRSFVKLETASPGFSTAQLLTMRVFLPGPRYEEDAPRIRQVEDLLRRLEAIPGIEAVGASNTTPLRGGVAGGSLLIQSRPVPQGKEPGIQWTGVSPHFFQTLGLSVLRGRPLTERESMERAPVAVVNEAFVRRFFPGEEALGQRFRVQEEVEMGWMTIVGVMPDVKLFGLDGPFRPVAFLPYPYFTTRTVGLTIRTTGEPTGVLPQVRAAVRASDPEVPIFRVATMEQVRQQGYWEFRFLGGMFSVFGLIALFLAAIGVYSVLSYSVSQRVREIGVRVALGAERGDVLRLIVGQGVSLALIGVGAGLLLAFGAGRVVASVLYDVSPSDPVSFVGIALLLIGVASLASFVPANRALAVDPLEVLRNE